MPDKMQLVVAAPCVPRQASSIYASSFFALQPSSRSLRRRRPMRREPPAMRAGMPRLLPTDGPRYGLRDLFTPLETLLTSGGDQRIAIDPASRVNEYGCAAQPEPEIWNFASSTASSISERAYQRAALAREELVHKSLFNEVDVTFDARNEAMREELRAHLQLSPGVGVVFSASGTDAQLHALFAAGVVLGAPPVTVVVGSDQTGSGTLYTARERHFSSVTASGSAVRKDAPVAGLGCESIALPLLGDTGDIAPRADADAAVLRAVEASLAQGRRVLLHIMDSSKLGWRAPSEACLGEIANRWPGKAQVVVDACQMRLGRKRLRSHLDPARNSSAAPPSAARCSCRKGCRARQAGPPTSRRAFSTMQAAATGRWAGRRCGRVSGAGRISGIGCAGRRRSRRSAAIMRCRMRSAPRRSASSRPVSRA